MPIARHGYRNRRLERNTNSRGAISQWESYSGLRRGAEPDPKFYYCVADVPNCERSFATADIRNRFGEWLL
jgi:hypothetical protein